TAAEAPASVCSSPRSNAPARGNPATLSAIATPRRQPERSERNSTATVFASKQGRSFLFGNQVARDDSREREAHGHRFLLRIGCRNAHLTAGEQCFLRSQRRQEIHEMVDAAFE